MRSISIQGPSWCFCCMSPSLESIEHDIPSRLYYFDQPVGLTQMQVGVHMRLIKWWFLPIFNKFSSFLIHITPVVICWHLWKARNDWFFARQSQSWEVITWDIFSDIRLVFDQKFMVITDLFLGLNFMKKLVAREWRLGLRWCDGFH